MSFEERSDESNETEDVIDRHVDDDSQEILISSTNEIDNFNSTLLFKRVDTIWLSCFMGLLSVRRTTKFRWLQEWLCS
jgi:hypothetical protein